MIYNGDCLDILPILAENSIQCCVTSPPYWGLRDYGVEGQLGLEKTPEEYVAKMVDVFREVRRVLRKDGTLWLNLGSSYAGSWGDSGHRPERTGADGHQREKHTKWLKRNGHPTEPKPPTVGVCDKNSSRSPLLQRVPACGNGGKESQDFQDADRAYCGSYDEPQGEIQNRHGYTVHNGQSASQGERQTSQIGHDTERSDCDQALLSASLPGVQESTIEQSSSLPSGVCDPEATASACPPEVQTSPDFVQESEHKTVCTSGTSLMLPPLVVHTVGKESFFSACGSPSCNGIGRCGLCWCNLAIPSLNVKPKDEINIPHLVAMALQADGWVLRETIVWHKPNPMPESVKDRCTKAHEYIFLLTKSAKYFYDAEAVKEAAIHDGEIRKASLAGAKNASSIGIGDGPGGSSRQRYGLATRDILINGSNPRSVWSITTKPYKEAHFATFPEEIPRTCILAGSKKGDTILDPFSGAGTTGVVAEKLDRKYIGIELNPQYVMLSEDRIYNVQPLFAGLEL